MNDCLSLPLRQGSGGIRRLDNWQSVWVALGEGEAEGLPAGRGNSWESAEVPGQRVAVAGRSSLWYRCNFARPDHSGRVMLRFGGAFLATNVWLNGRLLGSHYGYFGAFGFDITSYLAADNLLVVCCESPIETDLARKRHVMGIFNDGDSRPYPASAYFSLPEPYQWEVPVGLWRPVELEYMGPVAIDWLRLRPRLEAGDVGVVDAEVRLRNLDGRDMAGEIAFEVTPADGRPLRLVRQYRIPGGLESTLPFSVTVPQPKLWLPWRVGEPILHQALATVTVSGRESVRVAEEFGFRDVQVMPRAEGWEVRVKGAPFFLRGANYQPDLHLDRLTGERLQEDLDLAREVNLDVLRVHGHVLPEEFYRLADRAGMLIFADFPLSGAYAYHATAEEARFFEETVREQVPEMVEMLRNRACIALWTGHDDPPWIAANESLADVHSVRQNYSIDQEIQALFEKLDPSRPALAGSGDMDTQARDGWSGGGWQRLGDIEPRLVSEYGAQALPDIDSPVWDEIGRRWPVADDDPAWLYAGFQPFAWSERGVGLPSDYESLEEYIAASQEYQAWLIRFATDQFRSRKFAACWGAFAYQLVDPFPAIGFGLADHSRRPKLALEALRDAMAPTRVIIEPLGFEADGPAIRFSPARAVEARLLVVNDDFQLSGHARVRWSLQPERPAERSSLSSLRSAITRKSYGGSVDFDLPLAVEPAVQVMRLSVPLSREGRYLLAAELAVGSQLVDSAEIAVHVAAEAASQPRRRRVPAYLAERLVDFASLKPDPRGLSFELLNQTRPAALTAVQRVTLDGDVVEPEHILAEISGRTLPLPKRLELPVGRRVRLLLNLGAELRAGDHVLELDLTVPGVASGRVRLEGFVKPEELRPADAPKGV